MQICSINSLVGVMDTSSHRIVRQSGTRRKSPRCAKNRTMLVGADARLRSF